MVAGELSARRLAAVDWNAPWIEAIADLGRAIGGDPDWRGRLDAAAAQRHLLNAAGQPIRFGAPDAAGRTPYEEHIGRTGEVPTRDNLHDFFNAVVWLAFPKMKARLNLLQCRAIAATGVGPTRGAVRDAATLIDENALVLVTQRADLVEALAERRWRTLFVEHRAAWPSEIRPIAFGHALMEKLAAPFKGITAHALTVTLPADAPLGDVDAKAAAGLDDRLVPGRLRPLPVLGIPGWADNAESSYYDDTSVFRPARRPSPAAVLTGGHS